MTGDEVRSKARIVSRLASFFMVKIDHEEFKNQMVVSIDCADLMKEKKNTRLRTRFLWVLLFVLLLSPHALALGEGSAERYVARAGDVFISEQEFLERFELTPGLYRHRKPQLAEEKLVFLYSMIAEKLLAQEAAARDLDRDTLFQQAFLDLTKMVARDELYRQEVSQKVDVWAKEIQQGMARAVKQRRVSFLFFPGGEDAQFVRRQMQKQTDFDLLNIDSSMNVVRDTATVIWGDADSVIEAAAYNLRIGEVSPVLRSGKGFYIFKLMEIEPNDYYLKMSPEALAERVGARLRMRKERVRMAEFMRLTLKHTTGYSPPALFKQFARKMTEVFSKRSDPPRATLTLDAVRELLAMNAAELQDTLIIAGDRSWTVQEAIGRLYAKSFSVAPDAVKNIPARLYAVFREWVEQELLAQEALKRGLDRLPEVQQRIEPWREQYLAIMMKDQSNRQVTLSEAEVYSYLRILDAGSVVPQVQIRELRTNSLEDMREALFELERGATFEAVAERWNSDPILRKNKGLSSFFPLTDRFPLGEIASKMEPGQRYGPIRDSAGVTVFELVGKKNIPAASDTSFASRFSAAKQELLRMKQKRQLTLFLSQVASRRGFELYEGQLDRIQVTPIPMVTYRLLGFGGRMFAVPFVEKQVEWLEVEPPKGTIVP